jgi:hypothetical protein
MTFLSCLTACKRNVAEQTKELEMHEQQMSETYVDTMVLHQTEFNKQIVCNGRLRAKAKSELNFKGLGIIAAVFVKEGQRVGKGALIASLDKQEQLRELEKAEHELKRAEVELTDKLIGLGYNSIDSVPADVRQRAEVMSGYYSAKYELQSAKTALEECNLYAPFSGRIADLEAKRFQRNDKVCTLIDDSSFDVEFRILEAELEGVKTHDAKLVGVVPGPVAGGEHEDVWPGNRRLCHALDIGRRTADCTVVVGVRALVKRDLHPLVSNQFGIVVSFVVPEQPRGEGAIHARTRRNQQLGVLPLDDG